MLTLRKRVVELEEEIFGYQKENRYNTNLVRYTDTTFGHVLSNLAKIQESIKLLMEYLGVIVQPTISFPAKLIKKAGDKKKVRK